MRWVVREFKGVKVVRELVIGLHAAGEGAVLSGVEVRG